MSEERTNDPEYLTGSPSGRVRVIGRVNQEWKQLLLAILHRAGIPDPSATKIDRLLQEKDGPHAALMRLLAHVDCGEGEARRHWTALCRHREELAGRMGRDPGIWVALLDYFLNVSGTLKAPKIIERAALDAAERNAMTDPLTGLFNRECFEDSLGREAKRAQRYGGGFSLALLDLDDFKSVNDTHGESIANEALVHLSAVVRQNLRHTDLPCRLSGEVFAIILPGTGRVGGFVLADRIRIEVARRFRKHLFADCLLSLTLSGGVATYPDDASTPEDLTRHADRALYYSKRQGKNRVVVHVTEPSTPRGTLAGDVNRPGRRGRRGVRFPRRR